MISPLGFQQWPETTITIAARPSIPCMFELFGMCLTKFCRLSSATIMVKAAHHAAEKKTASMPLNFTDTIFRLTLSWHHKFIE